RWTGPPSTAARSTVPSSAKPTSPVGSGVYLTSVTTLSTTVYSFIGERPRGDQMVRLVSGVPAVLSGRMSAGDDSRQVRHTIHACAAMNTCYASRSYFMNLIVMNLSKHNARVNTHNAARDRRHSLKNFREGCLEAQP